MNLQTFIVDEGLFYSKTPHSLWYDILKI